MSGAKAIPVAIPPALGLGAILAGTILPIALAGGAIWGVSKIVEKLRETDRLRPTDIEFPGRMDSVREQSRQEINNRLSSLDSRHRRHESTVSGLHGELGNLESQHQKRMQREHNEFIRQIWGQRGELLQIIEAQNQRLSGMIEAEHRQRAMAVSNLQRQINEIVSDAKRKQDISRSFVSDLQKIVEDAEKLPHERFAPGEFESIRRHVEDAKRSIDTGMPEAALSTAQNAYWDLTDLRIKVIEREKEFLLIHQAALQEALLLLEQARANRKYQLDIGEGAQKTTIEMDVDFWTRGALTELEKQLDALSERLKNEEQTLSTDQVKKILKQIQALKPRPDEILAHAIEAIIASQIRQNVAELALGSLKKQGFELDDSAYEGNDERNSYVVKVRNIAGSEVVTVIAPIEGEPTNNTMTINSYDETFVDELTLQQRAAEIAAIVKQEGLQTGTPTQVGNANPDYKDIEAVRQRKTLHAGV